MARINKTRQTTKGPSPNRSRYFNIKALIREINEVAIKESFMLYKEVINKVPKETKSKIPNPKNPPVITLANSITPNASVIFVVKLNAI